MTPIRSQCGKPAFAIYVFAGTQSGMFGSDRQLSLLEKTNTQLPGRD